MSSELPGNEALEEGKTKVSWASICVQWPDLGMMCKVASGIVLAR